jgi:Acetyltransferase (GNAT) family
MRSATRSTRTVVSFSAIPASRGSAFFVRNGRGEIMAGLVGSTYAGWLFVADLWVHAELRRRGVGRELLALAERRAVELGCHSVRLDTFSFQSPLAWAFLAGHSCDAFFQLVDGLLRSRTRVPPIPPSQPPLGVTPTLTFVRTRAVGEPPRSATAAPSERQKQLESGRENSDDAMVN